MGLVVVTARRRVKVPVFKHSYFNNICLQSSVNPALLDAQPFQIRPAIFELGHKETTLIEVIFRPNSLGESSDEVLMLCDNCHMKEFTVTGE